MKKKLFSLKTNSVIVSWLTSYILILLVPVAIMVMSYFGIKDQIKNEINNSNTFYLGKVQQGMDSILGDIERLSMNIAQDKVVQSILDMNFPIENPNRYEIYKVAEEMNFFSESRSYAKEYYVYFKKLDMAVTNSIAYNGEMFYEFAGKSFDISYDEWKSLINNSYEGEYILISNNSGENTQGSILYIRSLPVINKGETTANVIIRLDANKFKDYTKGIESVNGGTIIIQDKNDNLMAASDAVSGINLKYTDMPGETGLFTRKINGTNMAVSYIASQVARWKYVSLIPANVFWNKVEHYGIFMFICLLVSILAGGLMSVLFIRKNYNPLNALIKSFEDKSKPSEEMRYAEYKFIQNAIHRTQEEKDSISHRLNEQSSALRDYFIEGLLKGKKGDTSVDDLLSTYDIRFNSDSFIVLTFLVENSDDFLNEQDDMEAFEKLKLLEFIITNVIEELANAENQGIMTNTDGMLACLICLKDNKESDWKENIKSVSEYGRAFMQEHYKVNLLISVSNVHRTLDGIHVAFKESIQTMEYNRVIGINDIVFYDNIEEIPKGKYYYPFEKEYQLANSIKAGEFEGAKALIEDIYQRNFQDNQVSVNIAKYLMLNLVSTIIKTVNENNSVNGSDFTEKIQPVETILQCETVSQMKENVLIILEKVCKYITDRSKHIDTRLSKKIIEYIEKNYSDTSLGIAGIAEYMEMNPNYISTAFKEQTGAGLLDFINNYRIKKAKGLLKDSSYNIEEIAQMVGYTNTRTFTRAFKRYEGVTPGKIRGE